MVSLELRKTEFRIVVLEMATLKPTYINNRRHARTEKKALGQGIAQNSQIF